MAFDAALASAPQTNQAPHEHIRRIGFEETHRIGATEAFREELSVAQPGGKTSTITSIQEAKQALQNSVLKIRDANAEIAAKDIPGGIKHATEAQGLLTETIGWADRTSGQQRFGVNARWWRGVAETLIPGQEQTALKDFGDAVKIGQGVLTGLQSMNLPDMPDLRATVGEISYEKGHFEKDSLAGAVAEHLKTNSKNNLRTDLQNLQSATQSYSTGLEILSPPGGPPADAKLNEKFFNLKVRMFGELGETYKDLGEVNKALGTTDPALYDKAIKSFDSALGLVRSQIMTPGLPADVLRQSEENYKSLLEGIGAAARGKGLDPIKFVTDYQAQHPIVVRTLVAQ